MVFFPVIINKTTGVIINFYHLLQPAVDLQAIDLYHLRQPTVEPRAIDLYHLR